MPFLPRSMRCSFHRMVGSYLETVCSHVRWKGACANLRRQTSSIITRNNNSHDKWCDQHVTSTEQSPTGIDLPYTGRISDALTTELQRTRGELGHIQIRVIYMYMAGSPRVHRSSVVRVSERCTEGLRFNSSRGLSFFLCSVLVTCWSQRFSFLHRA